jgi:hypothetical protein
MPLTTAKQETQMKAITQKFNAACGWVLGSHAPCTHMVNPQVAFSFATEERRNEAMK